MASMAIISCGASSVMGYLASYSNIESSKKTLIWEQIQTIDVHDDSSIGVDFAE